MSESAHKREQGSELTVNIVGLRGRRITKEERVGKGLGGGDLNSLNCKNNGLTVVPTCVLRVKRSQSSGKKSTNRATGEQVFGESLTRLDGSQGAWRCAVVGIRLDIDGGRAVVDDNSLVGRSGATEHGGEGGENAELHGDDFTVVLLEREVVRCAGVKSTAG